jgi:hypothetical protein
MSYPLTDIEGVDAERAALLKSVGIRSSNGLLEAARTLRARKALAAATGLSEKQLLRWVNLADCMRVRGISREYADLLRASGVDTVNALKYRNPAKLAQAMSAINKTRKLVRVLPSERKVRGWIDHAKTLPPKITY